jgi:hypothetical protein
VPATTREEVTQQQIDERQGKVAEETATAEAKAKAADDVRKLREGFEKQRQEIIKKGEDAYATAKAKQNAEYDKYRAMGERDSWGDHATAKKVIAGLAMILGGRRAAAIIIGAAEGFEAKKKEQLELQKVNMEKAGHDAQEIEQKNKEGLASLSQQTAAGLDSAAARLDAELAARGVGAPQRAANADILALKQAAFDKKRQAEIQDHKWAEDKLKDDLAKNKSQADIDLAKARSRYYDRMPVVKPAKTAGGGGGAGVADPEGLAKAIRLGTVGDDGQRRELTLDEKIAAAKTFHIPINAKSSQTSLDSINKTAAFDANQAVKQAKARQSALKVDLNDPTTVRDDTGKIIGHAPTAKQAMQFITRDADYSRGEDTLVGLLEDIKRTGNRALSPEEAKQRLTKYASAVIGVATVSPLGKTNESQKLEANSIGASGSWDPEHPVESVALGANPEAIQRKIEELRRQRDRYRTQTLAPPRGKDLEENSKTTTPKTDTKKPDPTKPDPKLDAAKRVKDDPTAPPAARARAQKYWLEHGQ